MIRNVFTTGVLVCLTAAGWVFFGSSSASAAENGTCEVSHTDTPDGIRRPINSPCNMSKQCYSDQASGEGGCDYIFKDPSGKEIFTFVGEEESYYWNGTPAYRHVSGQQTCFEMQVMGGRLCFTASSTLMKRSPIPEILASSILYDHGSISEAQKHLYAFGYRISRVDGKFGPETLAALMEFERTANLEVNGRLQQGDLDLMRSSQPPSPWAAIAYTSNGTWYATWNHLSRADAELDAKLGLERRSRSEMRIQSVWGKGCASVASYNNRRAYGVFSGNGTDPENAEINVIAACQKESGVICLIIGTVCADGRNMR